MLHLRKIRFTNVNLLSIHYANLQRRHIANIYNALQKQQNQHKTLNYHIDNKLVINLIKHASGPPTGTCLLTHHQELFHHLF